MANIFVKIGASDSELEKALKNAAKNLESWGKNLSRIGREMTQAFTLPIVGAAASVMAFSEKSKVAFESLGTSVKTSLGKVGDDIAKSINLQGIFDKIAVVVNNLTKAFMSLPDETKKFIVVFATIVAVVGPVLLIVGKLLIALGALVAILAGPFGLVIAIGAAAAAWIGYSVASKIGSESIFASQESLQKEIDLINERIEANRRLAEDLRKEKTGSMEWESSGVSEASEDQLKLADATERTVEADRKRIEDLNRVIELYGRWQVEIDETNRRLDIVSKTMRQYDDLMEDVRVKTALYGETNEVLGQKLNGLLRTQEGLFKAGLEGSKIYNKVRDAIEDTTEAIQKLADAEKRMAVNRAISSAGRAYEIQGGGVNKIETTRSVKMERYQEIAGEREKSGLKIPNDEMRELRENIEALQNPWDEFVGRVQASAPVFMQIGGMFYDIFQTFNRGIGNAIAQVIVYGKSLKDMMQELCKNIEAMVIATLITITLEWVMRAAIQAFASAFASICDIPVVGPFIAFGIAAAAAAALVAGCMAMGAAEGGIFTQPGITAIAERGRPEMVLNEQNIRHFFPGMLGGGGGGRPVVVHSHVILDGREIGKASARYIPDVIRGI